MKKSGRDESIWVVVHICMEAILGISLYSYCYFKLAKCYIFLIVVYVFSSTKLEKRTEQALPGSEEVEGRGTGQGGENGPNNICTYEYMNKKDEHFQIHKELVTSRYINCRHICVYVYMLLGIPNQFKLQV
jgi:hypothetical protein